MNIKHILNPKDLLDKYRIFIFDMDGVLWRGNSILNKSIEYLNYLKYNKKRVYFFTNNSSKDR